MEQNLKKTPLHSLHIELGAKMVPFAGYEMPLQYPMGIMAEHKHCREKAALFDVSHMGQGKLVGENAAKALETIVPASYLELKTGRQRYTVLTNENGGIMDDLMVSNAGEHFVVVVNAACKDADFAYMKQRLGGLCDVVECPDLALLALQGVDAGKVMARLSPETSTMIFMDVKKVKIAGFDCFVSRSGYTGEDGFEISVRAEEAESLARIILKEPEVAPVGLGARDTLRLEAGLCLYGSDINSETTPVEGGIEFAIGKRRREQGGFVGDSIILSQLRDGVSKKLVGIRPIGKMPARAHTPILSIEGNNIGEITSGGFSPTLNAPIAMGYVKIDFAKEGCKILLDVRGNKVEAEVVKMPFVPHRYYRG